MAERRSSVAYPAPLRASAREKRMSDGSPQAVIEERI